AVRLDEERVGEVAERHGAVAGALGGDAQAGLAGVADGGDDVVGGLGADDRGGALVHTKVPRGARLVVVGGVGEDHESGGSDGHGCTVPAQAWGVVGRGDDPVSTMRTTMRRRLDLDATPQDVLRMLRGGERPFLLLGAWAGGGAIAAATPTADVSRSGGYIHRQATHAVVGGGWFGWLGYGLGARIERLSPQPPRPHPLPEADVAFYDQVY